MTIIVLDGQGGGIGRAIIAALSPLLPQGAQLMRHRRLGNGQKLG